MAFLNYHHLRYFRAVAKLGHLTRAAAHLGVSQSALSAQLRQLEESLGQALFLRENKRLNLTATGRVVLDYAETIFRTGEELMTVLERQSPAGRRVLAVGAVATMSRNFQLRFLQPLIHQPDVTLVVHSGSLRNLLERLEAHSLDLVLSNLPVPREGATGWHSEKLAEQPVSLVGRKRRGQKPFCFPEDLRTTPVILPSHDSSLRPAFDLLLERAGIRPVVAAEVDDMAMLRLLARESEGVTLVPAVVVGDELRAGVLVERHRIAEIRECFYAITPSRRFPNELVRQLLAAQKAAAKTGEED